MVRSLDSKPDSRVNFEPDAWQIDVLDKIDNDESYIHIPFLPRSTFFLANVATYLSCTVCSSLHRPHLVKLSSRLLRWRRY
jgi:hypothetical protein